MFSFPSTIPLVNVGKSGIIQVFNKTEADLGLLQHPKSGNAVTAKSR